MKSPTWLSSARIPASCLGFSLALLASGLGVLSPSTSSAQTLSFTGAKPYVYFGDANLCKPGETTPAPCSQTLTLKYAVTAGGTLGTPKVLTLGSPGLDFTLASGSTCVGTATKGETCAVNVTFRPRYAGAVSGAVQVVSESGTVLATTPIWGTGKGPQIGTLTNGVTSSPTVPSVGGAIVFDGGGDIFAFASADAVVEQPANGGPNLTVPFTWDGGVDDAVAQPMAIDGAGNIVFTGSTAVGLIPRGGGTAIELPFPTLVSPEVVAVDGIGDVFVQDYNSRVYKLPAGCQSSACVVTVLEGEYTINGIAADVAGDLFVTTQAATFRAPLVVTEYPAGGGAPIKLPEPLQPNAIDGVGDFFSAPLNPNEGNVGIGLEELPANSKKPVWLLPEFSNDYECGPFNPTLDPAGDPILVYWCDFTPSLQVIEYQRSQFAPLNFGSLPIGLTRILELGIANTGSGTLKVSPSIDSPDYTILSTDPEDCLASITAAEPCTLRIEFSPLTAGPLNGALTLETNATSSPVVQLLGSATVDPPVLSPASGVYASAQSVSIQAKQSGATIHYTTDGSLPTSSSPTYTGPIAVASTERVNAIAIASGASSPEATASYTIASTVPGDFIDFSKGFKEASQSLKLNGSVKVDGTSLQLTDEGLYEAGSAFTAKPVNIQSFTTYFTFQLTDAVADGFTFTIQHVGDTALGPVGGYLGYEGIGESLAIKFDLHNNDGEGTNSTGLFLDGAPPTITAYDLTGSGIDLHSGDPMLVQITYDGNILHFILTDTVASATVDEPMYGYNVPQIVGANTAYVGFTGATGGLSANQEILSWAFTSGAPAPAPPYPPVY